MAKSLVIVESPTKARTISKYLGKNYEILATVGHLKDLPPNTLGVDIAGGFTPEYKVIRGKAKVLTQIRQAAAGMDDIYLAPDPDREGEAIAWHVAEELKRKNARIHRVLFHEITKKAIEEAIAHPQELDPNKFESQKARRILDRLVGYQISPILWEKVQRGLSAGRVQSVAVKIVVDREREVRAHVPEEYWTVTVDYLGSKAPVFTAKLVKQGDQKFVMSNGEQAEKVLAELKSGTHTLANIERKERRRHPEPPFITSKLQQEASRKLRLSPRNTMRIAQELYEGVDLGADGTVGLITYMRTDSTRISDAAIADLREFIGQTYGPNYLPQNPNVYKNRKGSQDAHEAIRPTSVQYTPERVEKYLSRDQARLYKLIFARFVASQMVSAVYDAMAFDIACDRYGLRATGQVLKFAGFTKVYMETVEPGAPNAKAEGEDSEGLLPDLTPGERLTVKDIAGKQNFTQPPPRFSEAMLVKELEERGIGRPSTYASILSTVQDKNYVAKRDGKLYPTELGEVVTDLLVENFPEVINSEFTAAMEEKLDEVEEGKLLAAAVLGDFWGGFEKTLEAAKTGMRNLKRQEQPIDLDCPRCGKGLTLKWGRNGSFVGCLGYPDCDFTSEYTRDEHGGYQLVGDKESGEVCEKCGGKMVVKSGRFGQFLACANYPACKNTKPVKVGVKCPEPGCTGDVIEKRTKRGKLFFGCDRYPACRFASWDKPVSRPCSACGNPYLVEKSRGENGPLLRCPSCGMTEEVQAVQAKESAAEASGEANHEQNA